MIWDIVFHEIFQRCFLRSEANFGNWKPFKNDDKCILFHLKISFCYQDIYFFVLNCRKTIYSKDKVNFKYCDVTTWETNNCNTKIAQFLKKQRQPDNEIQSVNRIKHEKNFSWKFNVVDKLFPDPFLKNQNWAYIRIISLKFYTVSFNCMTSWGLSSCISWVDLYKLKADHLLLPQIKLKKKTKRGPELVSFSHFLHDFWRKIFLLLYSINWTNFIIWLPLLLVILGNIFIVIVC